MLSGKELQHTGSVKWESLVPNSWMVSAWSPKRWNFTVWRLNILNNRLCWISDGKAPAESVSCKFGTDWVSFLSCRLFRAAVSSCLSSLVANDGQVFLTKERNSRPRRAVSESSIFRVRSMCMQSLARVCQCSQVNISLRIDVLCGSGSSPSNTGITHCWTREVKILGFLESIEGNATNLQDVFIIMCRKFFQLWYVGREPSNHIAAKAWHQPEAADMAKINNDRCWWCRRHCLLTIHFHN